MRDYMLTALETPPPRIKSVRCNSCGVEIARRLPNGGYTLLLPGPMTVGADGRVDAHCPSCGRRMRFRAATGPKGGT